MLHFLFILLFIDQYEALCDLPSQPLNGQWTCAHLDRFSLAESRLFCDLKCEDGHHPVGPSRVTCFESDSSQWRTDDGLLPRPSKCVTTDLRCHSLALPANGVWKCNVRRIMENKRRVTIMVCKINCSPGYQPNTRRSMVCKGDHWTIRGSTTEYPVCEDIDECSRASLNQCPNSCQNTIGSYHCSCQPGHRIDENGNCEDIDECSSEKINPCDQNCHNIDGSYYCSCRNGYKLVDGRSCEDIDECSRVDLNSCHQNCVNTDGSFYCSCHSGYNLIDDRNCEGCPRNLYKDGDQCKACPQNSYIESQGGISIADCKCYPGFKATLEGGLSCHDIDECEEDNFGCSDTCVNTPGGAHCTCADGFEVEADNKTCTDINECSIQNGGCEGTCHNTIGNFSCSCPSGYICSAKSIYSCTDVDECATNNGGCSHNCNNFDGGHHCSCNEGYHLDSSGKSCKRMVCGSVVKPRYSKMKCKYPSAKWRNYYRINYDRNDTEYPENTTCGFKCEKGYKFTERSSGIVCVDGQWIGTVPQCIASACPPLQRPDHGAIYPETCIAGRTTVGQRCYVTCEAGYKLKGNRTIKCRVDLTWHPNEPPICVPGEINPRITCPEDQTVELPRGNSSIWLYLPTPTSNTEYYIQEPEWMNATDLAEIVEFSAGKIDIKFVAVSSTQNGWNDSCVVTVHVIDSERPVITGCPKSFDVDIQDIQEESVHWVEPNITDNVGVAVVTKTLEPNATLNRGTHIVKYVAFDEARNFEECSFQIKVTSVDCGDPVGPLHGDANCIEIIGGKLCEPVCDSGFEYPSSENTIFICTNGQWQPSNEVLDCTAKCPENLQWSTASEKCEHPIFVKDPISFDVAPK